MKILQVMASNKLGGAEHFFCRLVNSLAEHPVDQIAMLRNNSPYVNELNSQVNVITAPFSGGLDFRTKNLLKKQLKEHPVDIVLSWMNRASGLVGKCYKTKRYQHVARLGGYYNLKYYQHCDHLIANTKGIADYLITSGVAPRKVHVISNFVEETQGTSQQKPDKPLIVALGRLHPNKAFDTLITAMSRIPNAELWIGGTGPLQQDLENQIKQLNLESRVKLLGWIKHPQDLIASADIFVCPSRHEPLGNVILEAWAQNKPIVATESQGAKELITNEKDGLVSPIDDAKLLADNINRALNDSNLRSELAANGTQTYQQQFSRKIITQQYLNFFQSLI